MFKNTLCSRYKEVGLAGWHVPTEPEWEVMQSYLEMHGYNYAETVVSNTGYIDTSNNKIAKALAAQTDWDSSTVAGTPASMRKWRARSNARWRGCPPARRADRAHRGARIPRRGGDECQGRFRRGGKGCPASLSDRQSRRRLRSQGLDAHPARRSDQRRGLYRFARGATVADRRAAASFRPMTPWFCRPPPIRRRASPISAMTRPSARRT